MVIFYLEGAVTKIVTTDENGNIIIEFRNGKNQTVLKRVQAVENPNLGQYILDEWADTYYVYDDFGNLRYVLPPEAVKAIGTPTTLPYFPGPLLLAQWAFNYNYDSRQRMIEKQVPGAAPVYMVYDARGPFGVNSRWRAT